MVLGMMTSLSLSVLDPEVLDMMTSLTGRSELEHLSDAFLLSGIIEENYDPSYIAVDKALL